MLMMCLLTAQTIVCTTGSGLPFKIMYLFTGNSDTVLFQVMKDDHIVICAQCALCRQGPQLLQTELVNNFNIIFCVVIVVVAAAASVDLCVDCYTTALVY
jgi:hypothetical protein